MNTNEKYGQLIIRHIQNEKHLNSIRDFLNSVTVFYSDFAKWWDNKVVGDVERHVVCVFNSADVVLGIIVLKNKTEKKISTLYVLPEYQKQHIGSVLVEYAIEVLGTTTPIITVAEPLMPSFQHLLSKYNFTLTSKIPDLYKDGVVEFVFNEKENDRVV